MSVNVRRLGARDQRVQRLRRLLRRSSVRDAEHAFVAEGVRLLEAALDARASVEEIFVSPEWYLSAPTAAAVARAAESGVTVFELGPGLMERIADTVSPQPICAVIKSVALGTAELLSASAHDSAHGMVLVCVDVRDPGNLGALVRIAGATAAKGVVCCAGTVDPFNPKVVRASAGAVFRVPLVVGQAPAEVLEELGRHGYKRWATVPRGGCDYSLAELAGPVALVLGNEGAGLPDEVVSRLDGSLTIPMESGTESLNVAMTAAVLCFDLARRHRLGSG